jgi:hypothetical protein
MSDFRFLRKLTAGLFVTALAVSPSANAAVISSGNSEIGIDPNSVAGTYYWVIDGVNQLSQRTAFYRIGGGAEAPLSAIGMPTVSSSAPNNLTVTYANAMVDVSILYTLVGGPTASGVSSLSEQITVQNVSGAPLDFHFFQYSNFDIGGDAAGDTATLNFGPGLFYVARQGQAGIGVEETVNTPPAAFGQADAMNAILASLTDGGPTTLNNVVTAGPLGDATWALQWDLQLAASGLGSSVPINMQTAFALQFIPEPSAFALAGLGFAAMLFRRRR